MDGIVAIGVLAAIAIACFAQARRVNGLDEDLVSAANVRRGVVNGWYECTLVRVDNQPAVHLSGKLANGETYSDLFPISEADWQALKMEGYHVEE